MLPCLLWALFTELCLAHLVAITRKNIQADLTRTWAESEGMIRRGIDVSKTLNKTQRITGPFQTRPVLAPYFSSDLAGSQNYSPPEGASLPVSFKVQRKSLNEFTASEVSKSKCIIIAIKPSNLGYRLCVKVEFLVSYITSSKIW